MVILENIDIDIDIDKAILQNIDIDKISNRFKFGISNRATTKPNTNTAVCHWIMIWCSFLLTKIDVMMYIVQDRWGLLADENRESLGAVNPINQWELS